jgi:putative endonuclease
MGKWNVYIVRCSDGSLYTGIAMDVARRVVEHNTNDVLAARYTRSRRPVMLAYQEQCNTRSAASKREYEIKQMDKKEKLMLIVPESSHTCSVTLIR